LLIRAEQGFGDTLQFCRYAPLAKARGFRVVMEVQPALVKLMGSLAGVEQIIGQGRPLPDYDSFYPMMSLPLAFATRLETIPAGAPYLAANTQNVALWRNRLPDDGGKKLKVGLVWAGKPRTQSPDLIAADHRRSMEADMLAPLMDIDGVRFFSLQKDGPPAPKGFGLVDLMGECGDFADTAALIANLDLVISVDTAMVHLAGALSGWSFGDRPTFSLCYHNGTSGVRTPAKYLRYTTTRKTSSAQKTIPITMPPGARYAWNRMILTSTGPKRTRPRGRKMPVSTINPPMASVPKIRGTMYFVWNKAPKKATAGPAISPILMK
jgi:hypothetical protein